MKVADLPGGDIKKIAFAPSKPSVVYLAFETNAMGVWRSNDAGETWRQVSALYSLPVIPGHPMGGAAAHIESIAVHPDDPNVVLVGDHSGLIKMVVREGGIQLKSVYGDQAYGAQTPGKAPKLQGAVAVSFSPSMPSLAYATDQEGNILKSTDAGDTWQAVSRVGSNPRSLGVDPRAPDILYVGTETGVFRSTNDGKDWQRVLTNATAHDSAISIASSGIVFVAASEGVYRTSDGGSTWTRTLARKAHSVQVATSNARVVYAGTPEGVFKSSDSGETWQLHTSGMEYINVGPIAVHPRDPNTVIAGSNINLWTRYGGPVPASTKGEGIYKSTDGGISWVRRGGEFIDIDVIELAVDPRNADVVYAGTRCSRGIYRSQDGGISWTILPITQPAHYTMRIATAADSVVWLTGGNGIVWSADYGQTWQTPFQQRHFHGIGISPHNPRLILVGTVAQDPQGGTYYPGARILRSSDGGRSWREAGEGFPSGADTAVEDFAFDPFNPRVVYVATSSYHDLSWFMHTGIHAPIEGFVTLGIYKSTDGGASWGPANTGLADKNVHSIVASPAKAGLLYAGTTAAGVYRSRDSGDTWTFLGLTHQHVHSLLIDPAQPSSLYAGTNSGLFWSPDGGETWHRLESVPVKPVIGLAMAAQGKVLYAAVNTVGVFKWIRP